MRTAHHTSKTGNGRCTSGLHKCIHLCIRKCVRYTLVQSTRTCYIHTSIHVNIHICINVCTCMYTHEVLHTHNRVQLLYIHVLSHTRTHTMCTEPTVGKLTRQLTLKLRQETEECHCEMIRLVTLHRSTSISLK